MIRYLLILFTGAIMLLAISFAWSKTVPPAGQEQAQPQAKDPATTEEKPEVRNPFKRPGQEAEQKKQAPSEEGIILNKLPQLSLKGILKMKDEEPVGLLVVEALKRTETFRVRKGDKISIVLAGEDVLRSSDLEPKPEPPPPETAQNGKKPAKKENTDQAETGAAQPPQKPKIKLKEIQVELEILEISKNGLAVKALPLNERILVR
ncbi:MAG: hypothetical protein ABIK28_01195 [Planctomycetota bacterium]